MNELQHTTKRWLASYAFLKMETENRLERLARLKNEAEFPAIRQGEEFQHIPGGNGKLERAVIRYMEYEERVRPLIEANRQEMEAIEEAVNRLADPMEREILRLRYIDGDGCRQTEWRDIAVKIYGDAGEAQIRSVFRLHGKALEHIRSAEF